MIPLLLDNMSDEPLPAGRITRQTLISDDYVQIALSNDQMMTYTNPNPDDPSGELMCVDIPQSAKDSGELPEGYGVGQCLSFRFSSVLQ